MFYFQPYLGKMSNLTSIFFRWVETTNQFFFAASQIEEMFCSPQSQRETCYVDTDTCMLTVHKMTPRHNLKNFVLNIRGKCKKTPAFF